MANNITLAEINRTVDLNIVPIGSRMIGKISGVGPRDNRCHSSIKIDLVLVRRSLIKNIKNEDRNRKREELSDEGYKFMVIDTRCIFEVTIRHFI